MTTARGFTLLEVLLAVAVLGLLAAAAAMKLGTLIQAATATDVVKQIGLADALMRESARHGGELAQLVMDLDSGTLLRHDRHGDGRPLKLPSSWRIGKVMSGDKQYGGGRVTIDCSPAGYTLTYAMELIGTGGRDQWLVVSGMSGQIREGLDETDVRTIFDRLADAGLRIEQSRRFNRCRGSTLIEVLAGLVLLGTVLALLVVARGRYLKQAALARQKMQAAAAADALLTQWWTDPANLPRAGSGDVDERMMWRTSRRNDPGATRLGGEVVRLELLARSPAGAPPLLTVDVVAPIPQLDPTTRASP